MHKFVHRSDYPDEMAFKDPEADILGICRRVYARLNNCWPGLMVLTQTDHCIDLICQVIQCTGDVGLAVFDDMGPGRPPRPRFSN